MKELKPPAGEKDSISESQLLRNEPELSFSCSSDLDSDSQSTWFVFVLAIILVILILILEYASIAKGGGWLAPAA